jgi:competence protein ComEA
VQLFDTSKPYLLVKPLLIISLGIVALIVGIKFLKSPGMFFPARIEVLESGKGDTPQLVTVEISGQVVNPGVYKVSRSDRVDDLINAAKGLTTKADSDWCAKYLNRAAFLSDGQKVYIPSIDEHSSSATAKNGSIYQTVSGVNTSDSKDKININTATLEKLESLPGIGRIIGQKIIEHRPYSTVEELVKKEVIKQSLLDKIIESISVF